MQSDLYYRGSINNIYWYFWYLSLNFKSSFVGLRSSDWFQMHVCNRYDSSNNNPKISTLYLGVILATRENVTASIETWRRKNWKEHKARNSSLYQCETCNDKLTAIGKLKRHLGSKNQIRPKIPRFWAELSIFILSLKYLNKFSLFTNFKCYECGYKFNNW